MKSGALNPRLRESCIYAGLPYRDTTYCFRRTRIVETKHEHGEAGARAIAAHAEDSSAHEYYDTVGVGEIDVQSCILGRKRVSQISALEKYIGILTSDLQMSRQDARKMSEQAPQTRYVQEENYEIMLRAEVEERLRERKREDSELVEIVQSFKTTIDDMREFLIRNSANATTIPRGYTGSVTGAYTVMSRDGNSAAGIILKELEAVSYKRKLVLEKIRRSMWNAILEELAQEMRSWLKTSTNSTITGLTAGKGGASTSICKHAKDAQTKLEGLHSERMSALEALKRRNEQDEMIEPDVDQEEGLNMDSLEENNDKQHPPDESLHWQDCPLRGRLSEHS